MLLWLILIPLIGIVFLLFSNDKPETEIWNKKVAVFTTLLNFVYSLYVYSVFDCNTAQYQYTTTLGENYIPFVIGIDGISLVYIILTTFTLPVCILASWKNVKKYIRFYFVCFLALESLLISLFLVTDLLLFYVFFESVLIPLFLIVGIWGSSENRIRASFLLFLYTLFGSLLMLLAFIVIALNTGETDLQYLSSLDFNFDSQKILWLAIFTSFAIKTPLVPFHIWLPRAHSEAPLAGSMILAGLILKLASYGFIRILIPILPDASMYFTPLVQTICLITIVYSSLSILIQGDTKSWIAYSSVAHMGIVILGLFSNTIQGIEGGILLSIAHGFVSPALFFIVGGVIYDRYHDRTIPYYRGLTTYMPLMSLFFFLFTIANAGTPLTANWAGEFMALQGSFQNSPYVILVASLSIVFSASYSIWLYNRMCFGAYSPYLKYTVDISRREYAILLALLFPTFLIGFFPNIILEYLHFSVSSLLLVL